MSLIKKIKNYKGFTILEVIIAIAIITMGMLGVSTMIIQGMQVRDLNRNNLVASMLAQEGLELVRNTRDKNWADIIKNNGSLEDWDLNIVNPDNTFIIDYSSTPNHTPNLITDADTKLYFDANNNYTHAVTAKPTIFSRIISVSQPQNDQLIVSCNVTWKERGGTKSYVADMELFNWR